MTFEIKVNQADLAEVNRTLSALADDYGDLTPLMRQLAGVASYAIEQNFQTEGMRLGSKWKPSQRALREKGKTLQDTGRLASSFTQNVTKKSAEVGTNVIYAAIHNFGGQTGRKHAVTMPERVFAALNQDEDLRAVDKRIDDFLDKTFR